MFVFWNDTILPGGRGYVVLTTDDALRFRDAGVDGIICDDPATVVGTVEG